MAQHLRANTAVDVRIGPFVDVTDGFTPETGVTLSGADEAELLKHDGAATTDISSNTWAAVTSCDGWYDLTLTASDTGTEGLLTVVVQDDSVCLPVFCHFMVLAEAAYDSLYVAKDDGFMDVNVKTIGRADTQETEASNLESACANYSATRGLAGTALPAAAADAAGGLPISDAGGLDLDAQIGTDIDAILVDTGTTLQAELDGIQADTEDIQTQIGTAGAGLTAVPWNSSWDAEVQSECQDAIEANHLDHLLAATYDPASKPGAADALLNEIVENDGGVSRFTANSLEQAPSGGTNPNVLADTTIAVVNSQTEFTLTAGSNDDDAYNDQAVVLYDASDSDYPSVRVVTDYVGSSRTVTIDSAPDFTIIAGDGVKVFVTAPGTTAPTAAAVADAVWDEASTGHVNAGKAGAQLWTDVDAILTDTADMQPKLGSPAGASISADIASVQADTDAIETDTQDIQTQIGTAGAGLTAVPWNSSWDAEVQSECSDALNAYDPPTNTEMEARTLAAASYFDPAADTVNLSAATEAQIDAIETDTQDIQSRIPAALVSGRMSSDAVAISGSTAAADNVEANIGNLDASVGDVEIDTQDIQSRLPAALVSGRMSSDSVAISGSTTAADNLEASAGTIVIGTVLVSPSPTTTTFASSGLDATNDHYNDRIVIFTSGVLQDQATDITDYVGSSGQLTVTAMTEAPSAGDTFVIV